jgi:hypothetical protein
VVTFNTWRRFDESAMRSPLAMCDARSISEEDLIPTALANYGAAQTKSSEERNADGIGQFDIFQAAANPAHKWHYFPKMSRDEVLVFKTFDSHHAEGAGTFIPTMHSAFDDPQCEATATPRESVECRVCAFHPAASLRYRDTTCVQPAGTRRATVCDPQASSHVAAAV